jgi:hypothetical protein
MKKVVTTYDLSFAEIESAIKKLFIEKYPELGEEEREDDITLYDPHNGYTLSKHTGVTAILTTTTEHQ